jgi:MerR family mercuric resistance operon transcriptional regulator
MGTQMQDELAIGDLARRIGVSVETIRYYERVGLMPRPQRTASGRRHYGEDDARTLGFIKKARELDFHLGDIRELLRLRGPDNDCSDVKAIARRHLETVRTEMRRAAEVERILSQAVAQCPGGSTINCSVLKVLDSAA